jgi:hypothetical protein
VLEQAPISEISMGSSRTVVLLQLHLLLAVHGQEPAESHVHLSAASPVRGPESAESGGTSSHVHLSAASPVRGQESAESGGTSSHVHLSAASPVGAIGRTRGTLITAFTFFNVDKSQIWLNLCVLKK